MSSTPFWLKVRKEYVFDNFEEMIEYLKNESYDGSSPSVNVDETLDCISEIISDINSKLYSTPLYDRVEVENQSDEKIVRLITAGILGYRKKGITKHNFYQTLINYILSTTKNINHTIWSGLWNTAIACAKHQSISRIKFSWNDIAQADNFNISIFAHKLSLTEFIPSDPGTWYYENKGVMVIDNNVVQFAADNFENFQKNTKHELFGIDKNILIISKPTFYNPQTPLFETLLEESKYLLASLPQIMPAPVKRQKDYGPEDEFFVRVTHKEGNLIVAETIDHRYNRIDGKLCVKWGTPNRPNPTSIRNYIEIDDIIKVKLSKTPDFTFDIEDSLEQFYREYLQRFANEDDYAIPVCEIPNGMLCVTQYGIRIVVHNNVINTLSEEDSQTVFNALESKTPLPVKFFYKSPDVSRALFNVYATLNLTEYSSDDDKTYFTIDDADTNFADAFLEQSHNEAQPLLDSMAKEKVVRIDRDCMLTFAGLLFYSAKNSTLTPQQKLRHLVASAIALHLCERTDSLKYVEYSIRLLSRLVAFCHNREVRPLTRQSGFDSLPEISTTEKIISALTSYRNPALHADLNTTIVSDNEDADLLFDRIETLVRASNSLIGVIDEVELNSIKRAIAKKLNLLDEFEPLVSDRTFYGVEGISLEFKSSIVFPPKNPNDDSSTVPNPELQKWEILKTVCGFLNSRSGGELILGVNDSGYAIGVEDDMDALVRLHRILLPNIDQYRLYVQHIIDEAFKEYGASTLPIDIVALNVSYLPETDSEGKSVLRVQVRPYPYGVVGFAPAKRPEGYADSYIRREGNTLPLTQTLRDEVEKYKIDSSSSQTRDITDIIKISKAIDNKQIVIIKHPDMPDITLEVYKIWKSRRIIYGYDIKGKKPMLYHLSDANEITISNNRWITYHSSKEIEIDDFGKILDRSKSSQVVLALTDFGYQSLLEIAPGAKSRKMLSAGNFVWQYECSISSPEGIAAFCMEIPDHVRISKGDIVKTYMKDLAAKVLKEM